MKVRIILTGVWFGTIGILEDEMNGMGFWNIRVSSNLRLCLKLDEFEIVRD